MTCVFLQSQVIEKLLIGDDDDDVLEKTAVFKTGYLGHARRKKKESLNLK